MQTNKLSKFVSNHALLYICGLLLTMAGRSNFPFLEKYLSDWMMANFSAGMVFPANLILVSGTNLGE